MSTEKEPRIKHGDRVRNTITGAQGTAVGVRFVHSTGEMEGLRVLRNGMESTVDPTEWETVASEPVSANATNPAMHTVDLKPRMLVLVITSLAQLGVAFKCATRDTATGETALSVDESRAHLLDEIVKVMEERSARV